MSYILDELRYGIDIFVHYSDGGGEWEKQFTYAEDEKVEAESNFRKVKKMYRKARLVEYHIASIILEEVE